MKNRLNKNTNVRINIKKYKFEFVKKRFFFIYAMLIVIIIILSFYFAWLQLIHPEKLITEGNKRALRNQIKGVQRGIITDTHGKVLAVSVPRYDVIIDPVIYSQQKNDTNLDDIRLQALAEVVKLSRLELQKKLKQKNRVVYLAKQITLNDIEYLKQLKIPGLSFSKTSKRYYPAGHSTSKLIGLTNNIDGIEVGIEGIERAFQTELSGESGRRTVIRDRTGKVIEELTKVDESQAETIKLSIDERLQALIYEELDDAVIFHAASSGTAVLLDIQSGEILAMASSPAYNPNNRTYINPSSLRNNAVTDAFEPGSTVKPFVVMAALENNLVNEKTKIDTKTFKIGNAEVKDVSYQRELDLAGILEKSSNVGVSKLALMMKPNELVSFYSKLGLGKPTELNFAGETSGNIGENKTYWADIERATYAYGYGLMVTPLQLARAYAVIGNYGVYKPVSILKVTKKVKGTQVVSKKNTKSVLEMLDKATQNNTKLTIPNYRLAIKTGTAKKVGANGRYIDEYIAYTAGVAPASNPKYSLVVIIDNPKAGQFYGGAVSGPVFSRIMSSTLRMLNVAPDK